MALLHLFHAAGFDVQAAHVNFKLRGEDSDEDERLVTLFCSERGIPLHSHSFATKEYALENGISTQMAARELRYTWFQTLATEHGLDRIATAHHLQDNLETLLLNLTKGTGPHGLTGIPVQNGRIIRPLLEATPAQIAAYLDTHKIPWREDLSNREDHYHRNRIRNRVIPELKIINPGLEHTFRVNLERFHELEAIFNERLEAFKATLQVSPGKTRISPDVLAGTPALVLEEFLKPYGFHRPDVPALGSITDTGKRILSATHMLLRERDHWRLTAREAPEQDSPATVPGEGIFPAGPYRLRVSLFTVGEATPDFRCQEVAWLDAARVTWPLQIRLWRSGDRFRPFGMTGSRLVSDYLKDCKIPAADKPLQWVVEDASGILWLAGHRTAEPYKVTTDTRTLLCLELLEM